MYEKIIKMNSIALEREIKDTRLLIMGEKEALETIKKIVADGIESKERIVEQERQLEEAEIYLDNLLTEKMKRGEGREIRL